jgi:hypothetical protein
MGTSASAMSLSLFETAKAPRTTVKTPFSWKEDGVVWRARYGRVSTDKQTIENQFRELRQSAERRGWEVVHEYHDAE